MLADLGGREFPSEQVWEVGGHMENRLHHTQIDTTENITFP